MSVNNSRRRWLWALALFTILITSIPYLIGYARQGSDWVFSGFAFGVEDGNSYIAKMLSGQAGEWLFRTPYTTQPQNGFLAFLPYLLLGKLAGGSEIHLQLVALFHLFRAGGILLYVFATYDFCRIFLHDERWQRWAVALATFGGGLGWVSILGLQTGGYEGLPLEFYSPESFGFLGVFGLPHLAAARALLLWGLAGFLSQPQARPFLHGLKSGIAWLLLGFLQPLTIVSAWAVMVSALGLHWAWLRLSRLDEAALANEMKGWWGRLWTAAGMLLISSPMVLYNFLSFSQDPFLKGWAQQNLILSPPVVDYLLAYGLALPLAAFGALQAWKSREWNWSIPLAWLVIFPLLAYFPYPLQRRLPEGVWVAWILLALLGIDRLRRGWRKPALVLLASGTLSTILFYTGAVWAVATPAEPLFQPSAKIAAYEFLSAQAPEFSNILGSYETGNSLPAYTPMRVVIGHGPESVDLTTLKPQVEAFFSEKENDATRLAFLQDQEVVYLFYGPDEAALGGWNPENSPFLTPVYSRDGYTIYQTHLPE